MELRVRAAGRAVTPHQPGDCMSLLCSQVDLERGMQLRAERGRHPPLETGDISFLFVTNSYVSKLGTSFLP